MIGKIIMFFTFPGAIINSVIKQILCRKWRIAIDSISYFELESFSWNINHELPKEFKQQLLIVILPFITGSLLGIILAFPGIISIQKYDFLRPLLIQDYGMRQIIYFVVVWLGISTVCHSVPKIGYSKKMLKKLWERENSFFIKLFCTPFLLIIYVANILTFFGAISFSFSFVIVYVPVFILERI